MVLELVVVGVTGKKLALPVYPFLALLDAIRAIDKILKLYKKFKKGNGFGKDKPLPFCFLKINNIFLKVCRNSGEEWRIIIKKYIV